MMKQLVLVAPNLKVLVQDEAGHTYVCIPAAAVVSRSPFEMYPEPADAPPGKGMLYVLLVRGTEPESTDLDELAYDEPHGFTPAVPPLPDNRCAVCLRLPNNPVHTT